MKFVHAMAAALLASAIATPVFAQEPVPLLRVYMDDPYFYDILAVVGDQSDPSRHDVTLVVEGKEVGETNFSFDCTTGNTVQADEMTSWSGGAAAFVPAALTAYSQRFC